MKYAVHIILLIQLFNCNRCKVRIIMWFNCFNSSHQLNDHIFLSRPSITHRTDTNLSLYNFPSLFLSSFTDVIHSGQNSLIFSHSLCIFYLVCFFTLFTEFYNPSFRFNVTDCARSVRERADHPTEDIFTCVHAHSARLARVCVSGLELGRDRWPGQITLCTVSPGGTITRYHPYPSIITYVSNLQNPENDLKLDLRCYIVKLRIQGCRYWV